MWQIKLENILAFAVRHHAVQGRQLDLNTSRIYATKFILYDLLRRMSELFLVKNGEQERVMLTSALVQNYSHL